MAVQEQLPVSPATPTRLPTSRSQYGKKNVFTDIIVTDWFYVPGLSHSVEARQRLLITAWAFLLRAYVLSDLVTFEVFGQNSSSLDTTSTAELGTESKIAVCQLATLAKFQHETIKYKPTIQVWQKSQLPSFEDLFNTGLSVTNHNPAIPRHLDFLLVGNCNNDQSEIVLRTRKSTVPKKFGQAICTSFKHIFAILAQNDISTLAKPILSASDQKQLGDFAKRPLSEFKDCLHDLVRKSVITNSALEAICSWDGTMSYDELDNCSDVIAKTLVSSGVKIGEFVPFAFEKSLWSVVAVLAILKSGAAFVPIDPTQPVARLKGILTDVSAKVVLTSAALSQSFKELVKKVVVVSADTTRPNTMCNDAASAVLPETKPHHPAFVLFTSGSTGKPKGMVMQHGAYSTHTICHGRAMGYERARVLQFAAHTFDVYVMDVFATLVFGGCVCIPSEEDRRFNIVKVFNEFRIDLAILTPSFAHVLEPASLNTLRTLAVGGEALKKETVHKWTSDAKDVSLIQIYGPAEVGICILGQMSGSAPSPETIGYPLDNSLCLLVDPDDPNRLVPIGAVGELVVAGPTMLREYLNNPEKTAASFLDDPAWAKEMDIPCRRFYRSGDLLRYNIDNMDGSFDFVGRKDSQVKYHGQRMELEDIEHHLSSIESVTACMVAIPKEGALNGRLVAIVRLELSDKACVKHGELISIVSNPDLTLGKMREHLSERLPGYMIPNALLVVQNVPFTPSLKLDRPQINRWVASLGSDIVTDRLLRKLCCNTLASGELTAHAISREYARLVGGDDQRHRAAFQGHDFCLQTGGIDSIQIISLSNFVQKAWKVKIPMSLILSSWATIRDVAAIVDIGNVYDDVVKVMHVPSAGVEARMLTEKLLADIRESRVKPQLRNVLLTGATGFLGIEILHVLLEQGLTVFALVRGKSAVSARQRLVDTAKEAGWWKDSFASKLEVWLGNLSLSNLGLDDVRQRQILGNCAPAQSVQAIIHNGAKVHYSLDYSTLKDINVSSTLELLKMTARANRTIQSFVYVSGGQQLTFGDDAEVDDSADVPTELGYARSKLVSEAVMEKSMGQPEFRETRLRIVKPGYIIGTSSSGVSNLTDFIWRLITTCVEVGGYDVDDADRWLFVADQKRVASTVVQSALQMSAQPTTKVLDGIRFTELWQLLVKEFSFVLSPLPHTEWVNRVRDVVAVKQDAHVMFPLMHMLESGESIGSLTGPSSANPEVKDAIRANLRYLIKVGYLSASSKCPPNGRITPDSQPVSP